MDDQYQYQSAAGFKTLLKGIYVTCIVHAWLWLFFLPVIFVGAMYGSCQVMNYVCGMRGRREGKGRVGFLSFAVVAS